MRCGWWLGVACAGMMGILGGCATTKQDVTGSGDERLEDTSRPDGDGTAQKAQACGSGPGDLVLLDARTAEPVSCVLVTLSREAENCEEGAQCPPQKLLEARTSSSGRLKLPDPSLATAKLSAVAEGYQQSTREPGPIPPGGVAEIEMHPADGFLLKFVDAEGNYLQGVEVVFRQGDETIARMKTNELANVWFTARTPFGGDPVQLEVEGYLPLTLSGPEQFGADGHTVTLRR